MGRLEVHKAGEGRYKASFFFKNKPSPPREKVSFWTIVDKDYRKLAQFLIDLEMNGFPIEKAIRERKKRLKDRNWMGI